MGLAEFGRSVSARYGRLAPAIYWSLTAIGAVYCLLVVYELIPFGRCEIPVVACDAYSYWSADSTPYVWEEGTIPFRYSPAFLWAMRPMQALPWELFLGLWTGLHVAAFVWLRAGWMLIVPGLNEDVLRGNIAVFLAVAAVLALRGTASWWVPILLTKITPAVGLAWHAALQQWGSFMRAAILTVGIVGIGVLIAPALWADWFRTLTTSTETYEVGHPLGPIGLRLVVATLLVLVAARRARSWLVPVAMVVAAPGGWGYNLAMLAAVPRLIARDRRPD